MLKNTRYCLIALVLILVFGWTEAGHVSQVDMETAEMYDPTCLAADATAQGCEGGDSCGTKCANDNLSASCSKIGKSPEEILRVDYNEDQADLTTSDHIDIEVVGCHNVDNVTMLPYNSATAVCTSTSAPNCHIDVSCSVATLAFTLTQDFIDNLDGTGAYAVRFLVTNTDDTCSGGDASYAEVDSFITVGGAAKRRVVVID